MGELRVSSIGYELEGQRFESRLVYDPAVQTPRAALVMAPNWMGITSGAEDIARSIAGQRYVVLIADLYGQAVRPQNAEQATAAMTPLKEDRALLRRRMQAALKALLEQTEATVDRDRLAAFGFCFGGCCALDLARDGAPLKAAVSFHGTLDTPNPADARNIKGAVLALDGAEDPLVPREHLDSFKQEMGAAKVDWQLTSYGGAVHSFTDPSANNPGKQQYNPTVAGRAYQAMHNLLDEVFA
ncbi:dienelactone hydrolase family protein [Pseudomonas mangiferae]|uniref:Dienelactone hydrolase family protein n=1 Tax=Pseudomonas mangiferae TaxID=2593654 RepID=A0A553GXW0_9PSED|nr:dienelactone hydrolase family protein [Pseudomonas mangiferae]TRX74335.1 dienelactone hydrolase family protein [Pseudomonas mangiferae]